jgi:hypothetical protein
MLQEHRNEGKVLPTEGLYPSLGLPPHWALLGGVDLHVGKGVCQEVYKSSGWVIDCNADLKFDPCMSVPWIVILQPLSP